MSDDQRNGSKAPMWWGIFVVLAFTAAATIKYNLIDQPVQAAAALEYQQWVGYQESAR